jgi:hypothetical protein
VGVVAHEAFRVVHQLVKSPVELSPSDDGAQAKLDLGVFPKQEMVYGGRALQRAHLGSNYVAFRKENLAPAIRAFDLQHTRAQQSTHHSDDREQSELG